MKQPYSVYAASVLSSPENFWRKMDAAIETDEILRYSFFIGFFGFAGYLFHYTITGQIWNIWPFVHTTLTVGRAIPCAILQWIFLATFPVINTLILETFIFRKTSRELSRSTLTITVYAMTPICFAAFVTGIPFLHKAGIVIGLAAFAYILFFGFRIFMKLTIWQSLIRTGISYVLLEVFRQIFVYVIGF
jgi:hypothetical protein